MIVLSEITKSFKSLDVLKGVDLKVQSGELLGLIGSNGAGKSTALRVLVGELLADSGSAQLGGHNVQNEPTQARSQLGYVPQDSGVEPFLTGEEVLRFVAEIRGVDSGSQVDELLTQFHLQDARRRLTREYSEGMARRLAIAAAFVGSPPALVLDECLNGLDPRGAKIVRDNLEKRRREGAAILLTGHVLETMESVCTRIALLHEGRIVLDMSMEQIKESGKTLEALYLETTA